MFGITDIALCAKHTVSTNLNLIALSAIADETVDLL